MLQYLSRVGCPASAHYYVWSELKKRLDVLVFHDDQHGTAVVAASVARSAIEMGPARVKVDPDKVAARTREYVYEGRLVPLE